MRTRNVAHFFMTEARKKKKFFDSRGVVTHYFN